MSEKVYVRSIDENHHICINSKLTEKLQVTNQAHENYGHFYFYVLKKDYGHGTIRSLTSDSKCNNKELENQINKRVIEAKKIYESRKINFNYIFIIIFMVMPLMLKGQVTIQSSSDTVEPHLISKDFYGKPYMEHYKDSIVYVEDSTRLIISIWPDIFPKPIYGHIYFKKYISKFLDRPYRFYCDANAAGTVYLFMIIDTTGAIIHPRVIRGLDFCEECSEKAIAVLKKAPKWLPGIDNNKKIPTGLSYPIRFDVELEK